MLSSILGSRSCCCAPIPTTPFHFNALAWKYALFNTNHRTVSHVHEKKNFVYIYGTCDMMKQKKQPPSEWVTLSNEAVRMFECGINETKFDNEVKILTIIHATSNETYQSETIFIRYFVVRYGKNRLQTHVATGPKEMNGGNIFFSLKMCASNVKVKPQPPYPLHDSAEML